MLWFTPKLPISDKSRDWVDQSFDHLIELFGRDTIDRTPIILPTEQFFPDDWDGTDSTLEPFFARVCDYMGVDRTCVDLQLFTDENEQVDTALTNVLPHLRTHHEGAAGQFFASDEGDRFLIRIKRQKVKSLMAMVAVMSHELGHVRLLGGGKISRHEDNLEPLTDLATVFFGMGIFTANAAENYTQRNIGRRYAWSMQRLGYLPQPVFGYALAKFAHLRNERKPAWTKHLVLNVREYCLQSLKVLESEERF